MIPSLRLELVSPRTRDHYRRTRANTDTHHRHTSPRQRGPLRRSQRDESTKLGDRGTDDEEESAPFGRCDEPAEVGRTGAGEEPAAGGRGNERSETRRGRALGVAHAGRRGGEPDRSLRGAVRGALPDTARDPDSEIRRGRTLGGAPAGRLRPQLAEVGDRGAFRDGHVADADGLRLQSAEGRDRSAGDHGADDLALSGGGEDEQRRRTSA